MNGDDIRDALEHAQDALGLHDIEVVFRAGEPKLMRLDDVLRYEDSTGWMELDPVDFDGLSRREKERELSRYRGAEFAARAMRWVDDGIIPASNAVVIVDGSFGSIIGDGRGRLNVARAFRLPKVWARVIRLAPRTPADRKKWLAQF